MSGMLLRTASFESVLRNVKRPIFTRSIQPDGRPGDIASIGGVLINNGSYFI